MTERVSVSSTPADADSEYHIASECTDDGLLISGYNAHVLISASISVAIPVYDSITVQASLATDVGFCYADLTSYLQGMTVHVGETRSPLERVDNSRSVLITEIPTYQVASATDEWSLSLRVVLRLFLDEQCTVIVDSLVVSGDSIEAVYPVRIHPMTQDGEPLLDPNRTEGLQMLPALTLWNNATDTWGTLVVRSSDEVLWLPAGHYNGTLCWIGSTVLNTTIIDFSIGGNESVNLVLEYRAITMRIDITPEVATNLWIRLDDAASSELFVGTLRPPFAEDILLPAVSGELEVSVTTWGDSTVYHKTITLDEPKNLVMSFHMTLFPFAGVAIPLASLFVIAFAIGLVIVVLAGIQRASSPIDSKRLLTSQYTLPLLTLLSSMFLPWSTLYDGQAVSVLYLPFPARFVDPGSGLVIMQLYAGALAPVLVLFWLPFGLAIAAALGHTQRPRAVFTVGLLIPALFAAGVIAQYGLTRTPGAILAVIALAIWAVHALVDGHRARWRGS